MTQFKSQIFKWLFYELTIIVRRFNKLHFQKIRLMCPLKCVSFNVTSEDQLEAQDHGSFTSMKAKEKWSERHKSWVFCDYSTATSLFTFFLQSYNITKFRKDVFTLKTWAAFSYFLLNLCQNFLFLITEAYRPTLVITQWTQQGVLDPTNKPFVSALLIYIHVTCWKDLEIFKGRSSQTR